MITINGNEYGLFLSVEARIEIDNLMIANPAMSEAEGFVIEAVAMNKAFNKANGIKGNDLKKEYILAQPNAVIDMLKEEITKQIEIDSKISVETKEPKGKNAKSASQ